VKLLKSNASDGILMSQCCILLAATLFITVTKSTIQRIFVQDSSSEDEWEKEEKERERDLQERDEFAKRMREKDEAKTRKIVDAKKVVITLNF